MPRRPVHSEAVVSAAFSPDGRPVVTASYDKTARLWDAATGKPIGDLVGHTDNLVSAALAPMACASSLPLGTTLRGYGCCLQAS